MGSRKPYGYNINGDLEDALEFVLHGRPYCRALCSRHPDCLPAEVDARRQELRTAMRANAAEAWIRGDYPPWPAEDGPYLFPYDAWARGEHEDWLPAVPGAEFIYNGGKTADRKARTRPCVTCRFGWRRWLRRYHWQCHGKTASADA
jgi:hypothetical protein